MKFISFFAGIGGIDLGLERAGHRCVGQVENDEYCIKVLEKHWADVPRWKDIRDLTGDELPEADLWTAGFPCQDISVAGKQGGIRGERTGLYFDFARLFRLVRPRFILLENVPALLNRAEWMGAVLGELSESGYDAEWQVLSAEAVGAPHLRERAFIFAYPKSAGVGSERQQGQGNGIIENGQVVSHTEREQGLGTRDAPARETSNSDYSTSTRQRENGGEIHIFSESKGLDLRSSEKWWAVEPDVGRVANGIPSRVDRLKCLGNTVVPQVAEYIGRLLNDMVGTKA